METRTAEQLTDEIEKLLKRSGIDPIEYAKALMGAMHATPEELALARNGMRSFFISKLQEQPEPTREDLSKAITGLRRGAFSLRKALMKQAKTLPAERGGRPKLLTKHQEAALNARISEQLSQGVDKTDAIRSAATKYGVSIWTVKRAWQRFISDRPQVARKSGVAHKKRRS